MNSSDSCKFGCAHFPARQPVAVSNQESIVPSACIPSRPLALSANSRIPRLWSRACGTPRFFFATWQAKKKIEVSATILRIRERRKTSQAVSRLRNGPGCGLSLLHPGRRGKTAYRRLREKSARWPRRGIRCRLTPAAPGIARYARTRPAFLQRQRSFGRTRSTRSAIRRRFFHQSQQLKRAD